MIRPYHGLDTARAAQLLVVDQFCVRRGETVVVTADGRTDGAAVDALLTAASATGAKVVLMMMQQLPYQGKLSDPYVPDAVAAAVASADVWFDMTFPYMAGSSAHDRMVSAKRGRYLLLGDMNAVAMQRLYGAVDLDLLFEVQAKFDDLMASNAGSRCVIKGASGTEISCRLGKQDGAMKTRRVNAPGSSTVHGSCIFYPEPDTVHGIVALDAIFHEHYSLLPRPIRLHVEGDIKKVEHVKEHELCTERALRRAANGNYGQVIHLTCGFHPRAVFSGQSFIEDIRSVGTNAIGLGTPWWIPGGGENHPDGVVTQQSLWLEGEQVVQEGRIVAPPGLVKAALALEQALT